MLAPDYSLNYISATVQMMPHQFQFMEAPERYVADVGGFGSGKSFGIGGAVQGVARRNKGFPFMLVSRSGGQLYNLQIEVEKVMQKFGWTYMEWQKFKRGKYPYTYSLYDGSVYNMCWDPHTISEIYCHTSENDAFKRWAGGNRCAAIIDEIDTMPKAEEVWSFANDRVRVGPHNQTLCASTPEGYGFLWDFFENQVQQDPSLASSRKLIRACTFENKHINVDYVRNQIMTRDPRALKAYVYGEFVNLAGATVYYNFDKDENRTDLTLANVSMDEILHIGVDFNKNINAANTSVIRSGRMYTFDECYGAPTTAGLIKQINTKYAGRPIRIYPDASGYEAIYQLEEEYGQHAVIYDPANPEVAKRTTSVNCMLRNPDTGQRRLFVNPQTAPHLFNGLMRQIKNEKGEPDKTQGLDHSNDGEGYKVWQLFPVQEFAGKAVIRAGQR